MNRATPRRGVSLLEVLISIFVISVGLMSLAMLIPAGAMAINEANKADRSGACGRSAMREVKIRRMLDFNYFTTDPGKGPFAIDPLGKWKGMPDTFAGLPRLGLTSVPSFEVADQIFVWRDDLSLVLPKDRSLRSYVNLDNNGNADSEGHYSWFMTVTPSPAEADLPWKQKSTFSVSVAVCHNRGFDPAEEKAVLARFHGPGFGGGTIQLSGDPGKIRTNQWIMLCDSTQCKWYRVVSAAPSMINLTGPDWHGAQAAAAVIIEDVIGVYSTTVEIDRNLIWNR